MKDQYREAMQKPIVSDERLAEGMDRFYKEGAVIGSGSTAAAVREELRTGEPVQGLWHSQKAEDGISFLQKWLEKNPNASNNDIDAAKNVIIDMQNALKGR